MVGDLAEAGVKHPSVIRWKVFTLPATLIARRVGHLAAADASALDGAVRRTFAPT